jgi:hypothetical protein
MLVLFTETVLYVEEKGPMLKAQVSTMKDLTEVKKQCELFISTMADNRPNCDDAGVARRILEELESHGQISTTTRNRLFRWCDTNGTVYQRGVPIAQEICRGLYGRVLGRNSLPPTA